MRLILYRRDDNMSFFLNENEEKNLDSKKELIDNLDDEIDVDEVMENLEESTTIRITASSKYQSQINAMAIQIAKEEDDRDYQRYIAAKKRWRKHREIIRQKYQSRARARVDQNRSAR